MKTIPSLSHSFLKNKPKPKNINHFQNAESNITFRKPIKPYLLRSKPTFGTSSERNSQFLKQSILNSDPKIHQEKGKIDG